MENILVSGIAYNGGEAKVSLLDVPDRPGIAATIFSALAEAAINVDMILQNISIDGTTDLTFTVGKTKYADDKRHQQLPRLDRRVAGREPQMIVVGDDLAG